MLRVVDFGRVSPLRSQTCWHAVAYGVSEGAPATLSFARPSAPYACLGYHRDLAEIDRDYCRSASLPVYRRMVGGGPVYLDSHQLFFQICLPAAAVPASRAQALRALLAPAVAAFRAAGVDAALDGDGEICAGEAKISGHGAGQIEDAVVVCGNLIERFDHERATAILALDNEQRAQTLDLMRRHVAATPVDPGLFQAALVGAYGRALGLAPVSGALTDCELAHLARLDVQFAGEEWLAGPARPPLPDRPRQVKVRAGVWTFASSHHDARVVASVVRGSIRRVRLAVPGLNGATQAAQQALAGIPLAAAPGVLAGFGEPGRKLAVAFAAADEKRI